MERKNVLLFITELSVGGAQEYALETAKNLNRNKYEVHIMSSPYGQWENRALQSADKVILLRHLKRNISIIHDLLSLIKAISIMRRKSYQIVHTHSSKAGFIGRLAAKVVGIPLIVHTVHGFSFNDYMSPIKKKFYLLLERIAALWTDKLITVAEQNRLQGIENKVAPIEKFTTIYNGFNINRYNIDIDRNKKRLQLGLDPNSYIIGTVARLSKQKAPTQFIKAAFKVMAKRKNVQFVWVGDGPLRSTIEKLSLGCSNIKLLGTRYDVPEILHALDVFIQPSLWEGLSRTLVEAMLCSLPIVATDVNGTPELIENKKTGLLVPSLSPDSIASAILYYYDHPKDAIQMGRNARKRVTKKFSNEMMVSKTELLYSSLLK